MANIGFPSEHLPNDKKSTREYHLDYIRAAYNKFQTEDYIGSNKNKRRIRELQELAEGIVDTSDFKKALVAEDGDSYVNLDYKINSPIPKFIRVLTNKIINRGYEVQATTIDPESKTEKDIAKAKIRLAMEINKSKIPQLEGILGNQLIDRPEEVPETDEEYKLYVDSDFKLDVELDTQELIKSVFLNNEFVTIEKKYVRDIVAIKYGGAKVEEDTNHDIKIMWIDPEHLIHSPFEKEDCSDMSFIGQLRQMSVADVRNACKDEDYDEETLFKAMKSSTNLKWNGAYNRSWDYSDSRPYDDTKVGVVDLEWKTSYNIMYEKRYGKFGSYKLVEINESYKRPKKTKYKRETIHKVVNCRHRAKWVTNSDVIFDYGRIEDDFREKVSDYYSWDIPFSFVMRSPDIYKGNSSSLLEQVEYEHKQMCLIKIKIQQHIARAAPKGAAFDISALENVFKGAGGEYLDVLDLQDIYRQTGDIFYSSVREDGSTIQNTKPIFPMDNPMASDLERFIGVYNFHMNNIRDILGLNEITDASTPNTDTLKGVAMLAEQATNNSISDLTQAFQLFVEAVSRQVILKAQKIISEGNKKSLENVIGKQGYKTIGDTERIQLSSWGIHFEYKPAHEDIQVVQGFIQRAMDARGEGGPEIPAEEGMYLLRLAKENPKLAERRLRLSRKNYAQEKMERSKALQEQNAQVSAQAAEVKKNADIAVMQAAVQKEVAKIEAQKAADIELEMLRHEHKMKEMTHDGVIKEDLLKVSQEDEKQDDSEKKTNLESTEGTNEVRQPAIMPTKPTKNIMN